MERWTDLMNMRMMSSSIERECELSLRCQSAPVMIITRQWLFTLGRNNFPWIFLEHIWRVDNSFDVYCVERKKTKFSSVDPVNGKFYWLELYIYIIHKVLLTWRCCPECKFHILFLPVYIPYDCLIWIEFEVRQVSVSSLGTLVIDEIIFLVGFKKSHID